MVTGLCWDSVLSSGFLKLSLLMSWPHLVSLHHYQACLEHSGELTMVENVRFYFWKHYTWQNTGRKNVCIPYKIWPSLNVPTSLVSAEVVLLENSTELSFQKTMAQDFLWKVDYMHEKGSASLYSVQPCMWLWMQHLHVMSVEHIFFLCAYLNEALFTLRINSFISYKNMFTLGQEKQCFFIIILISFFNFSTNVS